MAVLPRVKVGAGALAMFLSSIGAGVADAARCWQSPVAAPVVDPYREPACRWCPGNRGIEYGTRPGAVVRAVAAGRVEFAGAVAGRRYVVVRHVDGWRATYGGLSAILVERGDVVLSRSIVGRAGDTVHFGLRDGDGYRDPGPFLGRLVYRPRLVPTDGSPGAPAGAPVLRCNRQPLGVR
jgi:murein DD-endopeptidase MepM/ murein hydrolase activator NlpD